MTRPPRRPLALAALAFALALALPAAAQEPRTITVTGTGEVAVPPDRVELTLGVAEGGRTAAAALEAMSAAMRRVIDRLEAEGVPARDVQTSALELFRPEPPAPGEPRPAPAFEARSLLTVTSADLDGAGALVDALVAEGANELRGIRFTLSDPGAAADAARRAAVAEARAAAETYAEAAGVTPGRVLEIAEETGGGPRPFAARMAAEGDVPLAPGTLSVTRRVRLVIELAD